MASTEKSEKNHPAPTPSDIFEGLKGRPPKTLDELNQWLATDEGKAATIFDPTTALRYGDGRS